MENLSLGKRECCHYLRGCRVLAECCKQWVGCRLCHDERFDDHKMDRHAIQLMQCLQCETVQPCARECLSCGMMMGEYFCQHCNLFDHDGEVKGIFHCYFCGICRVGGQENFFHCKTCGGCYPNALYDNHTCVEDAMHRDCAICFETTFECREGAKILPCGHLLHQQCFKEYTKAGFNCCPHCRARLPTG